MSLGQLINAHVCSSQMKMNFKELRHRMHRYSRATTIRPWAGGDENDSASKDDTYKGSRGFDGGMARMAAVKSLSKFIQVLEVVRIQ